MKIDGLEALAGHAMVGFYDLELETRTIIVLSSFYWNSCIKYDQLMKDFVIFASRFNHRRQRIA